ncbi:glycosyltransferase [Streptomyces sp. NRRL F-5135]|uniref:glycosyltransferase n=1 Tax=Streptomyces sp. NRRL F-5135 TaxID=1463858 RepID=UPI0007C55008|nr:glycosyltransferase [Streptomyces sp. NRRL F-5135]
MRVLLASTGGSGHFTPLVPFIDALAARGDEVLVVAQARLEAVLAAREQPYRVCPEPPPAVLGPVMTRVLTLPVNPGVIVATREVFGGLHLTSMLPVVEEACRSWRPDLVLHESYEYASVVAAERHGIPHARVAVTAARFSLFTDAVLPSVLEPYGADLLEKLRASPYLTRFPASVDPSAYAVTRRYHEPAAPGTEPSADRWGGDGDPLVYLTLGTEAGGMPNAPALYRAALDAVGTLPVRVLVTVGSGTDVSRLGPLPPQVRVERWVPQAEVLAGASAVVCHGGSGTVFGALSAGVPLVCVPLFADQPTNARLVAEAGAGVAVEPTGSAEAEAAPLGPADIPRIREAVEAVLKEPSYRTAAARLGAETRATPTAGELLDDLDSLDGPAGLGCGDARGAGGS